MKNFLNQLLFKIFSSKLCKFLLVVLLCAIFNGIISYFTCMSFFSLMIGSVAVAGFLAITDNN